MKDWQLNEKRLIKIVNKVGSLREAIQKNGFPINFFSFAIHSGLSPIHRLDSKPIFNRFYKHRVLTLQIISAHIANISFTRCNIIVT